MPSGKLYEFQCGCGHVTSIDSLGRVFWMLVLGVCFAAIPLVAWEEGGILPWVGGVLGLIGIGSFGHEVYKRIRAPEIA